jgi:hypothetical protein
MDSFDDEGVFISISAPCGLQITSFKTLKDILDIGAL